MHCPKCGSIINNDAETCKFCKTEMRKSDRSGVRVETHKLKFTWFNWIIMIVSLPLGILWLLLVDLPSLFSTQYKVAIGTLFWAVIFIAAFIYEVKLYKQVNQRVK